MLFSRRLGGYAPCSGGGFLEDLPSRVFMTQAATQAPFVPTEHPLLPLPTVQEMELLLRDEKTAAELMKWLMTREARIKQAEMDPLNYGFELDHWRDADKLLEQVDVLYIGGGNRSGKTEYCTKRAL